jgi:hypothetical protein
MVLIRKYPGVTRCKLVTINTNLLPQPTSVLSSYLLAIRLQALHHPGHAKLIVALSTVKSAIQRKGEGMGRVKKSR